MDTSSLYAMEKGQYAKAGEENITVKSTRQPDLSDSELSVSLVWDSDSELDIWESESKRRQETIDDG